NSVHKDSPRNFSNSKGQGRPFQKDCPNPSCPLCTTASAPTQATTTLARKKSLLRPAPLPLLAAALAVGAASCKLAAGDRSLWTPCNRLPLRAPRCKWLCLQAVAYGLLPLQASPSSIQSSPCRGPWPHLVAPLQGTLAIADRPLAGVQAVAGGHYRGPGYG
ncbi:hypothetical protein GW17_00002334, partial [Ensete ventricosum]